MHPTPFADLNTVLAELVAGVRAALGDSLVAVCLQGSFAVGDYDEHSDVDFVVVVEVPPSEEEVEDLQAMHGRVHDLSCPWAKHLEGSYFPRAVLRRYDRRGELLWYLDHGSRALIRSDHCNTAVVRETVRTHGVPLAGPVPATLVDPIPVSVLRDEIEAKMRDWGRSILLEPDRYRNRFYQGFIVLSYCRMLHDLTTGAVGSKRAGARWAKAHLEPRWSGLIDRAWLTRPDPARQVLRSPDPADFQLTLDFVRHVLETRV